MMGILKMIRKMDQERLPVKMAINMKEILAMVNLMVKEYLSLKEVKFKKDYLTMENFFPNFE